MLLELGVVDIVMWVLLLESKHRSGGWEVRTMHNSVLLGMGMHEIEASCGHGWGGHTDMLVGLRTLHIVGIHGGPL